VSENIEKAQSRTWTKKLDKKYGKTATIDMIDRDPFLPTAMEEKLRKSLPYQSVVIPNEIARKNNVRVSTVKTLLRVLESEGELRAVSTSARLRVYTGVRVGTKAPKEAAQEAGETTEAAEGGEESPAAKGKGAKGAKGKKGGKGAKAEKTEEPEPAEKAEEE
jgi:ribosomal protein S25